MIGFRICEAEASPQRRGRAHEEALCRQLMLGTGPAVGWLKAAGFPAAPQRALASPLGGTHKADIFIRGSIAEGMRAGRISAKLCSMSAFDITQGYRNHLHGCGVETAEAFGLIPSATDRPHQRVRHLMREWQTGASILNMSRQDQEEILLWLRPRWSELTAKFLFGEPGQGGHGVANALICTIAKVQGQDLVAEQCSAINRDDFLSIRAQQNRPLEFLDACGGCFGDGLISLQARGSQARGLQAKLNVIALMGALNENPFK